jgi:hypothetical protein
VLRPGTAQVTGPALDASFAGILPFASRTPPAPLSVNTRHPVLGTLTGTSPDGFTFDTAHR